MKDIDLNSSRAGFRNRSMMSNDSKDDTGVYYIQKLTEVNFTVFFTVTNVTFVL
jgi:hypothetical protein